MLCQRLSIMLRQHLSSTLQTHGSTFADTYVMCFYRLPLFYYTDSGGNAQEF